MKFLVRLEEFGLFLFSIYLFFTLDYPWWLFPLLLFAPDISMIGYLGGSRLGAILYNFESLFQAHVLSRGCSSQSGF